MSVATPSAVLDFWFDLQTRAAWFDASDAIDEAIAERFSETVDAASRGDLTHWLAAADDALALTITLDQFPRNLHRQSPQAWDDDARALEVARESLQRGFDQHVSAQRRMFFYMPFMHSETLAEQQRSVELFRALGDDNALDFAHQHHDIIARFGRFPHRNAVLGRETTDEEAQFLDEHGGF